MADEQQAPQQAPTEEKAKFTPNGNGNGNGHTTSTDGHGNTKYAPPKSDEQSGDGKKEDQGQAPPSGKAKASPRRQLITGLIVAVLVIFALIWGVNYYHYATTHVSTDDAYVTGNLVNVSPIISGTLNYLDVEEGDLVKSGQVIARLEDSGQRAAVRQSQASYDAAETQLPQAQISLAYQQAATNADIQKAQSELGAQNAKTAGAQEQAVLSAATVENEVHQSESQLAQYEAQAAGARAQVASAQSTLQAQLQGVQTAQSAANAANANIAAAVAVQVKDQRDEARYAVLVRQQAVTQQQYDAAQATAISASSQLEATRQQSGQANSQVATARANVGQARGQLRAAQRQAEAANQQVQTAVVALQLARANLRQIEIQRSNVANNVQQGGQAQADLATAQAGRQQISLRRQEIATYQAQAAEAKAALANAQVTENDTVIYAPINGQVVRKAVNVGAALSAGQTIVTMTSGDEIWVSANFKETQLTDVRVGQPAEVEVDTFPGRIFNGKVQAIEEATGASTALLPPDNATGNFTKVVQRVPVRIQLIAASDNADKKYARASDIENLRQGLSVTATIDTSNAH